MGASVGTEGKGSVNVELNIVPFIDLMSCLTAFLLVTAVWVNIAQINIQPKGKTRDTSNVIDDEDKVVLSVLVQSDKIWVGLSRVNEFQDIPKLASGEHDWDKFETTIKQHKTSAFFSDRADIEVAAESTIQSPVKYQDVIRAMDVAVKVGFLDVGLSDPAGLAARPQL
ncbi:MAG TPA: biopolymer transporter ExbD [Kofleriaceae bacterium]|nr:biopolymer transporter ExbD [Kofleriaceae bacterium]